jgi:apolipoprotein N-acyltransferase
MKQQAIAFGLGAVSAFAFQPFGWWPLMPLAFAVLCELVDRAPSMRRALLAGWLFGVGQFVIGLNWIATAFTYQSAMPAWLGWVAVVLLSLYLAVYPLFATALAWRIGKGKPLALVLAMSGAWALTEWLRAGLFTGFAWNPVSVAMVDTPLRGLAAGIGTYGLSSVVVIIGGLVWLAVRREFKLAVAGSAVIALAALSVWPQKPVQATGLKPVRIVQPNIGQQDKWRPGFDDIAARRLDLLSIEGPPVTRLLFWPEAAVTNPLSDQRADARWQTHDERLRATRSLAAGDLLLTGGIGLTSSDGLRLDGATNSVFVLAPLGRIIGRYDKAHLVPYGEYLPMRPLLSAIGLSRLAPGDLDFKSGPGPRTVTLPDGIKVGFQLCYEIIFSGEVVDRANRPHFIFNPSNDAWFGAWGPPQHLAQARLRAAEEGLPVIRSTPTGISALIDAKGGVIGSIPLGRAGVIDGALPLPAASLTPFARAGKIIPIALGFLLIIAAIAVGRSRRYSPAGI